MCAALLWNAFIWAGSWLAAVFDAVYTAQPGCLYETSSGVQPSLQQPVVLCCSSYFTWRVCVPHRTGVLSQRLWWNKESGSHFSYLLGWFQWSHVGINVVWYSLGPLGCVWALRLRAVTDRSALVIGCCLAGAEQSLGSSFKWRGTGNCSSVKCHQSYFLPVLQVDVLVNKTNLSLQSPNSVLPFYPSILF